MNTTQNRLRETLVRLGLTQAEVARWQGIDARTMRRYLAPSDTPGAREVPPALVLLLELMNERPELVAVVRQIADRINSPDNRTKLNEVV